MTPAEEHLSVGADGPLRPAAGRPAGGAYRMPAHRRLLAWLVTDRVGQGLALTLMFAWAAALYARGRLAGRQSSADLS